ncbi:hypothetical protein [Propionivibrio dicarboxylicus]|uniref:hypothetical protein n=1 Tax=Propionivibrio dicarboxylicus TaxID=83767 RepID=UPI0015A1DF38|nr:hypothetical protein [Propionivibrio dicarboxylicus]
MADSPGFVLADDNRRTICARRSSVRRGFQVFLDDASLDPECGRLRQRLGIAAPLEA